MKKKNILIILSAILIPAAVISILGFISQMNKNGAADITGNQVSVNSTEFEEDSDSKTEATTALEGRELTVDGANGKYVITKTDFEKKHSEEFLMDIAEMLGMAYGYEDFIFSNEDPEKVVNSLLVCCIPSYKYPFKSIYCDDEQVIEKGIAELKKLLPDNPYYCEFVEIETLNAYLEDMFGPGVRKFRAEEFMTIEESVKKYGDAFNGRSDLYSAIRYLPESDLLCFCSVATGFSCRGSYIYDIREMNGDYVVCTLGGDELYFEEYNYNSMQAAAFEQLSWEGPHYLKNFVYTFGCTDDGNLYLKSIDKNYLFAEGFEPEYRIVKDTKAFDEISYLFPAVTVGNLKKGDIVHVDDSGVLDDKEVAYIITEDFAGNVDYDCVEKVY